MKKIFYFAIAAMAIMSCSKTEPVYTQPEEISFMPVSRIESKAAVTGINYTADQNFYVFANTVANPTQKYFENIEFKKSEATIDNPASDVAADVLTVFVGNPTQYWPNVTPLKFFGVTKSGNVNTGITPATDANFATMTLTGYEQPSPTVVASNDLMYFFDDNAGAGYTKGTEQVIPVMKHACSWLTFNMQAEAALTTYWEDLEVTAVKLLNLNDKGNAVMTSSGVTWNTLTYKGTPVGGEYFIDLLSEAKELTTTPEEFATVPYNTIVIPQTPTKLYITYSYKTPATTDGDAVIEETKEIDLATWTTGEWVAGKHYIYNLTVTAEEIKIAPRSTDWNTDLNGDDTAGDTVNKEI